jgi:acyl carrier protein
MQEYENLMAEVLEVDSVNQSDVLAEFDCWDSLTVLSIIAMADESFQVSLSSAEVNQCKTIGDLKKCINEKRND